MSPPVNFFLTRVNCCSSLCSTYFNEFLLIKNIFKFNGNYRNYQKFQNFFVYCWVWKKIFMKRKQYKNTTNLLVSFKPKKTKILISFKNSIWSKSYFFFNNSNSTKYFCESVIPLTLNFYFLNKIQFFIYFLNKIQFFRVLFLTLNFKSFSFFNNKLNKTPRTLILLNSKFI